MRTWAEFSRALAGEVDWHDADYRRQAPAVEEVLRSAAANPGILRERTEQILDDQRLFDSLAPHMNYPRILMDKFVLHIDPADRFRVRMHRFKTRLQNGGAVEKVHYHKWNCSTIILRGSYSERQFTVEVADERTQRAQLRLDVEHTVTEGRANSLPARRPHQVINQSDTEPCLTLFVRGPSLQPNARIFDVEAGTFYDTFDPAGQLRVGLSHMGRLDPAFH